VLDGGVDIVGCDDPTAGAALGAAPVGALCAQEGAAISRANKQAILERTSDRYIDHPAGKTILTPSEHTPARKRKIYNLHGFERTAIGLCHQPFRAESSSRILD